MGRRGGKKQKQIVEEVDQEVDQEVEQNDGQVDDQEEDDEEVDEDANEEDEESGDIGDSTSDNYTDSEDDLDEEDEPIDGSISRVSDHQNGNRIEYESPDAIADIDDDDESETDETKSRKKKRKLDDKDGESNKDGQSNKDGLEVAKVARPKLFKSARDKTQRLIIILERANLELVKTKRSSFEVINCDDHMGLIRKYRKDPAFCRPDITHQCLLMLFDSPLNRAGLLQVYIHTINNILIEVIASFLANWDLNYY